MRHGILSHDERPKRKIAGMVHCFAGVATGVAVGLSGILFGPKSILFLIPFVIGFLPPRIVGESTYPGDAHAILTGYVSFAIVNILLAAGGGLDLATTVVTPTAILLTPLGSLAGIRFWRRHNGTAKGRTWTYVHAAPKDSICDCPGGASKQDDRDRELDELERLIATATIEWRDDEAESPVTNNYPTAESR